MFEAEVQFYSKFHPILAYETGVGFFVLVFFCVCWYILFILIV